MADKIKPHTVERVKKIRAWELKNNYSEAQHIKGFKKYKIKIELMSLLQIHLLELKNKKIFKKTFL